MNPIQTTSGKTVRANLAQLRQKRMAIVVDQAEEVLAKLDALADQAYATVRMMREHSNLLRHLVVDAKQTVAKLRKAKKLDVEL